MKIETQIKLNKFRPRSYQLPLFDAVENKGYKRILLIWPRRAGKDLAVFNLAIRAALKRVQVIYYIFPTYAQGKKVIFDSITNDGERILNYIPEELIESKNTQELKIRFVNGSLIQVVGSDNYDCFDDKTEILTEDGWKLFKDLTNEKVATLIDGYLKYEKPHKYIDKFYNGPMYKLSNSSWDFLVTPMHRFWVVDKNTGHQVFKRISDPSIIGDSVQVFSGWVGETKEVFEFPKIISTWKCGKGRQVTKTYDRQMPMEDFVALLGIYLAEGSSFKNHKTYRIIISQTKPWIKDLVRDLLEKNNINYCETTDRFNIEDRQLYEYFSQFGTQEYRFIPKEIKNLSKYYLSILWQWLVYGDGTIQETYCGYYSISKRLIDDIQEILIKLGYSANVSTKEQTISEIQGRKICSKNTLYQIRIRTSRDKYFSTPKERNIKIVDYSGRIYCVSVSSGIIKVRRNGKEYWSGNSLMGTNPQLCIFSEYALQDPRAYMYIRPILTANDGCAIFLSTPRGKNHLWDLYQIAQQSDAWFCQKLTVLDTDHISLHEIEKERSLGEMSDDMIQQEYYTSFDMGVEGSYYAKYLDRMRVKAQIGMVPWENGFKVHTAWDLGVRDATTIIFFQVIGQTVRIIDCYENSKVGLDHYVKILEQKPYTYGKHIAPHDIKVQEFGSGLTRIEKARQLGINFTIAPDLSIEDGIEAVRSALSKICIDDKSCASLVKALENYRQEYDIKRKVYKSHPLHDWSSHWADAMRYLCISLSKTKDGLSGNDIEKNYREAMYGTSSSIPSVFRDDLPPY